MEIYIINTTNFNEKELIKQLSAEEKLNACALRQKSVRKRYIISRALRRKILAKALSLKPEKIIIENALNGKPFIPTDPIHFNMSHSKDLIVLALSEKPVGVDTEFMKKRDFIKLIRYALSSKESAIYSMENITQEFYRWWTVYEAGIKLEGLNILSAGERYPAHYKTSFFENYALSTAAHEPFEPSYIMYG